MSAELDLFGQPIPASTPKPPAYDKRGTAPIAAVEVAERVCGPDVQDRPYVIIKEDKYSAILLHTDIP